MDAESERTATGCDDVASYGSLALDGSVPVRAVLQIGSHLRGCDNCATYVDQMAKTRALLGTPAHTRNGARALGRSPVHDGATAGALAYSPLALAKDQAYLMTLARATDPAHADDLVQDTWDHFLSGSPATVPDRQSLAAFLIEHAYEHTHGDEVDAQAWADDLIRHHPHRPADAAESDQPADPANSGDWRTLADLDVLDPDADPAELYFPELYGDGPDRREWASPPVAWPSISRLLGPDQEVRTAELYSVVDSALDELPDSLGDVMYLLDIEGHSLATASSLLGRNVPDLQRDLVSARNHVRGRVDGYLRST
jgi:DNA-directed RNA polymerase specialized sigma24 family protein